MRVGLSHLAPQALLFVPLVLSLTASPQTVVPITSEPDHHLVISNDYVRVFQVEVPPKADTLYHQHNYDYLYVAIGDADVTSTRLHENPVLLKLRDGEVEFSKGPFAHKATNNSDQPFRNVTIELLQGAGKMLCTGREAGCGTYVGNAVGNTAKGGSYVLQGRVINATSFSVSDVLLGNGSGIGPIRSPFLLVAVSDVKLVRTSQNSTQDVALKAGDTLWIEQPETKLRNSSGSAKLIIVDFSPAKTQ